VTDADQMKHVAMHALVPIVGAFVVVSSWAISLSPDEHFANVPKTSVNSNVELAGCQLKSCL
jgi:hypothetical protein